MNEEEIKAEAEKKAAEEEAVKKLAEEKAKGEFSGKTVEELVSEIRSTRSEAKERRLKERGLEEEIAKMKAAQKKIDEDKLLADGKLQELIDSKTSELADLQAKLVTAEIVADESKAFKAMQVEKYKKRIGSKWLDEYANLSLIALESLADSLAPKKIGSDNGAGGEIIKVELDADQKRDATAKYPHVSEEKAYEYHRHNLIKTGKIKEK